MSIFDQECTVCVPKRYNGPFIVIPPHKRPKVCTISQSCVNEKIIQHMQQANEATVKQMADENAKLSSTNTDLRGDVEGLKLRVAKLEGAFSSLYTLLKAEIDALISSHNDLQGRLDDCVFSLPEPSVMGNEAPVEASYN